MPASPAAPLAPEAHPTPAFRRIVDGLLDTLVVLTTAALVLDVCWQVFTRFALRAPSPWTDETATFLLVWLALLGAAVALRRGAHLGVDYFVLRLSPGWRRMAETFAFCCSGLFALAVMVVGGSTLVLRKIELAETSPVLGLNMGFVYLALPVSGVFLTLYSVEFAVRRWREQPMAEGTPAAGDRGGRA